MMYSNRLRFRVEGEGGPEGKAAEVHHLGHRPRDAAERPPQRVRRLGAVPQQGVGGPLLPLLRRGGATHVRFQDVPKGKMSQFVDTCSFLARPIGRQNPTCLLNEFIFLYPTPGLPPGLPGTRQDAPGEVVLPVAPLRAVRQARRRVLHALPKRLLQEPQHGREIKQDLVFAP